jgi:hypothetical protein
MLTTAGVTALTIPENPSARTGGTAAALPTVVAGGATSNPTANNAPANPLPATKESCTFMECPHYDG